MKELTIEEMEAEIERLEASKTGIMMADLDIADQIHNLRMKINGTKPMDSHFDCIGCGS